MEHEDIAVKSERTHEGRVAGAARCRDPRPRQSRSPRCTPKGLPQLLLRNPLRVGSDAPDIRRRQCPCARLTNMRPLAVTSLTGFARRLRMSQIDNQDEVVAVLNRLL